MTQHTVLSVGQCRPDQAAITQFLKSNFDVQVATADLPDEAVSYLRDHGAALVLINRKLDADYSDGMEILDRIKSDEALAGTPVMLVSNFPEWQDKAVEQGAIYGFGKAELNSPDVVERLSSVLTA